MLITEKGLSKNNSIIQTTSNSTKTVLTQSERELMMNHFRGELVQSIEDLFTCYDIGFISKHMGQLFYYAMKPTELDKEVLIDLA